MIKAVLFDLDGVLIDSLKTNYLAYNSTLKRFGKKKLDLKKYQDVFWGPHIDDCIKISFGNLTKKMKKKIADHYHKKRLEFTKFTRIYKNVMAILKKLKKKFKLGLVTSTVTFVTHKTLEYFDIKKYFDVIVCGDEAKPKPAPDAIFRACNELKIIPEEAIYIGDNFQDVEAGKKAKCFTVAITTTSSKEELKDADKIINNFNELIKVIK